MKKLYNNTWVYAFLLALAAGFILRDTHSARLVIAGYSSALAPTPGIEYQIKNDNLSEGTPDADTPEKGAEPININTAPKETLILLDGIGDKMAQRIIDYRTQFGPFQKIEDLMKIKGIGEKKFEKIKSHITVN